METTKSSAAKLLLSGNEAIALGAWEAGVCAEWASNETVALDAAIGASLAGARAGGDEARGRQRGLRQPDTSD